MFASHEQMQQHTVEYHAVVVTAKKKMVITRQPTVALSVSPGMSRRTYGIDSVAPVSDTCK